MLGDDQCVPVFLGWDGRPGAVSGEGRVWKCCESGEGNDNDDWN